MLHNHDVPPSRRVALRIAYLGTGFAGWQRQLGQRTVQGELERAAARLFVAPIRIVGAGRTDAGVHAIGQVCHLDIASAIPTARLSPALNALLPPDVRVMRAWRTGPSFHARRSAQAKQYRYRLGWGTIDPWLAQRCWVLDRPLDLGRVREALTVLPGEHDFAAFALAGHAGTGARGTRRTLLGARLVGRGRQVAVLLEGDGFLRGMARRLVGALVEVGRGARDVGWLAALLASPGTRPPAPTAPAHGLTLERVTYGRDRRERMLDCANP